MKQKYKLLLIILIFIILSALGFVCGKRYLYKPALSKNVILFSEKEKNIKTSPLHIIMVNTKLNIQASIWKSYDSSPAKYYNTATAEGQGRFGTRPMWCRDYTGR